MTNIHKINEFIENNNIKNELTSNFERLLKNTSKKELEHARMELSIIEALCDEMTIETSLELGTQLIMKKRIVHE